MDTTQVSIFCVNFYDPLGIISPFLIRAKILLQEMWKHEREWDKAISGDNGKAIKDWVEETELLGTVGVNRLLGGTGLVDTMENHVFCDDFARLKKTIEDEMDFKFDKIFYGMTARPFLVG